MNDHDHGDEDPKTRHKPRPGTLTDDEIDYLLAVGARDAAYYNPRSTHYRRINSHLATCALNHQGPFCNCYSKGHGR